MTSSQVPARNINITWPELVEGVARPSNRRHDFVVERKLGHVYNLEGIGFHEQSAVMLPIAPPRPSAPPVLPGAPGDVELADAAEPDLLVEQVGDGLILIRNLLSDTAVVSGMKGLVVGHAGGGGAGASEVVLSGRRAENVFHYLAGDKSAWAASCAPFVDDDWQRILAWIAQRFGVPCHPGEIAHPTAGRAMAALKRFREVYNRDHGGALVVDGPITTAEFEAFYDFYDAWLARMLDVEPPELAAKRSELSFLTPSFIAAGQRFRDAPAREAGFRPPQNRRVELVFFAAGEEPDLGQRPPGTQIYGGREYSLVRLEIEPTSYVLLEVAFAQDVVDALPLGASLTLTGPGPAQTRVLADGIRELDMMRYFFDWLDSGATTTLEASADGESATLWRDQVKGDLEATPEWEDRLETLLPEEAPEQAEGEESERVIAEMPDNQGLDQEAAETVPKLVVTLDLADSPADGIRFVVTFSDGNRVEGVLGPTGRAVVDRLTHDFEISFPGLEDEDWELAET